MSRPTILEPEVRERAPLAAIPVLPAASRVTFADALGHDALEAFRDRLVELFEREAARLRVDLLLVAEEERADAVSPPGLGEVPDLHLVVDLHRLFLFRPAADRVEGFRSLLRFLKGSYPVQPRKRLEKHMAEPGYRFLYPLEVLEVLPLLRTELEAGEVATLDLVTGEVDRVPVPVHPDLQGTGAGVAGGLTLEDRFVGESLRESFPTGLEDFLSPAAVVQKRFTVRDRLSMPLTTAEVKWWGGRFREACYGRSRRRSRAETVAVCEAMERFQIAVRPADADLVLDSYRNLQSRALDPLTLFFGRHAPGSGMEPVSFDPEARLHWTTAAPLGGGEPLLVPAQEVWFHMSLLPGETTFVHATTNACALGGSVEEAGLFGLLEAVERDAFITSWYLKRRPRRIDPDSVEDPEFHQFRHRWQLAFPQYRFRLFDITSDMGLPTVMAIAVRRPSSLPLDEQTGPKVFVANACRPNAEAACRVALEDLSGFDATMTAERREELRQGLARPEDVQGPSGHFELFALDESYEQLSFLDLDGDDAGVSVQEVQDRGLIEPAGSYNLKSILERIDAHSRSLGVGIYLKDITHDWSAERGLRCVKAITPGLFPIWFGHDKQRYRRTRRLERLAHTWFEDAAVAEERLDHVNLGMHPFS